MYKTEHRKEVKDLKGVWKSAGFGGYPGLKHTAKQISKHIPKCKIYVEPFAGLGRVAEHVKADRFILNDKSEYAFDYLTKHFNAEITNLDFEESIRLYDSNETFFLIDPPWHGSTYGLNDKPFIDRKPIEYFKRLLEIVPRLKGNWFITSSSYRNDYQLLMKTDYYHKIVKSEKRVLFGKKAKTMITSNLPIIHNSNSLCIGCDEMISTSWDGLYCDGCDEPKNTLQTFGQDRSES
jgi:site-specific DNA-adenine methylase